MAGTTTESPQPARDTDPRVERSRHVILGAALDLLGEVGFGALTIEAVAARAGVGKSTIYRHWTGKLDLVEDAIRTLKAEVPVPQEGTVRQRVVGLLQNVAVAMGESTWSHCLPAIIDAAERDPEVLAIHRRIAQDRRQVLVDLMAEGVARGELAADLDLGLAAECMVGAILVRRLLLHEPVDPRTIPALVEHVLAGDSGS